MWTVTMYFSYRAGDHLFRIRFENFLTFFYRSGRRRWSIENSYVSIDEEKSREVPDVDTRLLRGFRADQSWVLEPGDMLYLPPRVPHNGTLESICPFRGIFVNLEL